MGIYNPYVIPFPLLLSNTVLGRTRLKKTQLKRGGDSIPKTRDLLDVALLMNGLAIFIGAQRSFKSAGDSQVEGLCVKLCTWETRTHQNARKESPRKRSQPEYQYRHAAAHCHARTSFW